MGGLKKFTEHAYVIFEWSITCLLLQQGWLLYSVKIYDVIFNLENLNSKLFPWYLQQCLPSRFSAKSMSPAFRNALNTSGIVSFRNALNTSGIVLSRGLSFSTYPENRISERIIRQILHL